MGVAEKPASEPVAPWRDLPEHYGPWQSVYHWFNRWRRDGTWDQMLQALQVRLDREGRIDWDLWCIDGTTIRASRAAAGAAKKGAAKNPQTTLWAAQEAHSAQNSTWLLTGEACRSLWKQRQAADTNRPSLKR
ncbi:MAG: transposase [Phycisphaerae bacterium]|nr:transposase [Phycisphaerae bacterium]